MKVPAKASILLQKVGPELQNAQKRLYYSKELDHGKTPKKWGKKIRQNLCRTRQSVYIVPQKWTKLFSWVIFSRKIDALTGVSLPQLRLRFVGINRYAIVMFAAYAARKICRATPIEMKPKQ